MKTVSIITPSYNQGRFLPATLASVLSQDYPAVEYIVVDGGSTDGSVDVIRELSDRFAWWTSERDSGQAEAINRGMARATGEYVAWLNSDDMYLPGAVARAVEVLDANPDVGLVYANGVIIDEEGRVEHRPRSRQFSLVDLLGMSILHQPTVFMRRSAWERAGGLEPTYHLLLDHHLWIRIAKSAEIRFVDEWWAAARRHAGAKNSARGLDFAHEADRLHEELRATPDLAALVHAHRRSIDAGRLLFDGGYLALAGQTKQALEKLVGALARDPLRAGLCAKLAALALVRGSGSTGAERLLYGIRDVARELRSSRRRTGGPKEPHA